MNRRTLAYGCAVAGTASSATVSISEHHPIVIALAFPAGALMSWMVWLAADWRPCRGD